MDRQQSLKAKSSSTSRRKKRSKDTGDNSSLSSNDSGKQAVWECFQ